jgi:hypothetical protein
MRFNPTMPPVPSQYSNYQANSMPFIPASRNSMTEGYNAMNVNQGVSNAGDFTNQSSPTTVPNSSAMSQQTQQQRSQSFQHQQQDTWKDAKSWLSFSSQQ